MNVQAGKAPLGDADRKLALEGPKCGDDCAGLHCMLRELERKSERASTAAEAERFARSRAELYARVWRRCCRSSAKDAVCGEPERVLEQMVNAFRAASDEQRALEAELRLIAPATGLGNTDTAKRMRAALDARADRYEQAASGDSDASRTALGRVVAIRLALGQTGRAVAVEQVFFARFAVTHPRETAQVELMVLEHFNESRDDTALRAHLGRVLPLTERSDALDLELRARALSARAHSRTGKHAAAKTEIDYAISRWNQESAERIRAAERAGDDKSLGAMLTAVGEVLFLQAESARRIAEALPAPAFHGRADAKSVRKFLEEDLAKWTAKRQELIEQALQEYKKVVDLQPAPPPRWVIASGARVGQMHASLANAVRAIPMPAAVGRDGELRALFRSALDATLEKQEQFAVAAFKTCETYAISYEIDDEFSRECTAGFSESAEHLRRIRADRGGE